ncbi:hypothetical protein B0H15DRAFT_958289 [Mycena belliarum]|uniref:CxC2-like cysteine cluster KDZ transposase-associated domain-containing protein n=1 Tax=Mycena belliarum TaxID=1033014 RepID=A0AAD6TQG3_9AGAR|nr:hypothetical protein B0H15DRAFT_958289 [Mycena belliae]
MSHKRKAAGPQVVVGARGVQSVAGPSAAGNEDYEEDLNTNFARSADNFSWALGDTSMDAQPDDHEEPSDGITVVVGPTRYRNSDRPLHSWLPHRDEYLQTVMEGEARGPPWVYERCAGIGQPIAAQTLGALRLAPAAKLAWRSITLGWTRMFLSHVVRRSALIVVVAGWLSTAVQMQRLPTHFVERWNGQHFVRSRTGLRDLGLRIQLEHPPGVICPSRRAAARDFVLYDTTGIHEIAVDFCGCMPRIEHRLQLLHASWWPATVRAPNTCATFGVLKLFQILNCLGKLSAYDFLRGLEMCTNHDGLDKPPDRRKPFMHIMRQWRDTKRMKRFGRGNKEGGVEATGQGELVLHCRQCPQEKYNLPPDWDRAPPFYKFIYFLFLAQDANFRLTNRNVSSEEADPILGDGWGIFAKREGADGYKVHIGKHANQQEISSCSGFQAMFLANTKKVKGLRTTGIAGVTCSRHNMWRPNGMGDLQVGERYCNLDYLMLAAVLTFTMAYIVLSYDIACQFSKNFWQRMKGLPENMRLKIPPENLWWKVPNFHLPPHKPPCHSPYSFHYMWGAGMTHGEGVEQNWSFSNGAAASTKLMGPGSRHATLEDIFGFHNYDRQLAMHRILPKRLAVNLREGAKHKAALQAFTQGLEAERAEEVAEWRELVLTWEATQHTTSAGSPFEYKETVTTLRDIQLKIATEEFICTEDGVEVEQESTPSTFIMMGLDLEDMQRRLEIDVKSLQTPTATQKLAFMKRRTALLKKIHKFRDMQRIYMPALRGFLTDRERQVMDGNGEQLPEATRLFMPSEMAEAANRSRACASGLGEIEARMREGEAEEALEIVRQGLRSRTLTNRFRIKNYTGQGALTRGQGILRQINLKIHLAKVHYRYARAALLALRGHGAWEHRLKVLKEEDVRALNERALVVEDEARGEQLDDLAQALRRPAGVTVAEGLAAGEGSHTLSWIWYTVGTTSDEDDPKLHEALRVEWCKAFSRDRRFEEDIRLLQEEMRRTIASGYTEAKRWDALASDELPGASPELTAGRQAYAAEKAHRERRTCAVLTSRWAGILAKAEQYLEGGEIDGGRVMVELELGDELAPDDEEALLEADYDEEVQ